jgi:hypothetical protein
VDDHNGQVDACLELGEVAPDPRDAKAGRAGLGRRRVQTLVDIHAIALHRGEKADAHTADVDDGRLTRRRIVAPGTAMRDAGRVEGGKGVGQSVDPEVAHMVVGQRGHADPGIGQHVS